MHLKFQCKSSTYKLKLYSIPGVCLDQIQAFVLKYILCEVSRRFVVVLILEPWG